MATRIENQRGIFELIGEKLKEKVKVWVIGGSAMLYYGFKEVTKDIDIVLEDKKGKEEIIGVLKGLGFRERPAKMLYGDRENLPLLLQRGEDRFDVFYKKIVSSYLSEEIKERVSKVYEYGNLVVEVVSPEDIILLKSATERAGDRLDAAEIIKRIKVDWDVLVKESINQMKLSKDIVPLSLYDFLGELKEDLKVEIPEEIIEKIGDVCEEEFKKGGRGK